MGIGNLRRYKKTGRVAGIAEMIANIAYKKTIQQSGNEN